MAKKQKTTPHQRIWLQEESVELLTWLELNKNRPLDFEDTVLPHLRTRFPQAAFDLDLVRQKTYRLWYRHGESTKFSRLRFYEAGLSYLPYLPDELRVAIREREAQLSRELSSNLGHYRLRSTSTLRDASPALSKTSDLTIFSRTPSAHAEVRDSESPELEVGRAEEETENAEVLLLDSPDAVSTTHIQPFCY